MAVGNDDAGARDVMINGGNSYTRVCCKLLLEPERPRDGTHVKDLKDLVEDQPPDGDHLLIFLRVE